MIEYGYIKLAHGRDAMDCRVNRGVFTGNQDGTMAEQAAYTIIRDLQGADMVIDIHSSNIFLREIPQVRINVQTADKLVPYAKLLDVDFIWVHEAATVLEATLAHSQNSLNTPTLVVEMGVGMRINHGYGNRLVNGILNLMHAMGIWGEAPEDISMPTPTVSIGNQVNFINADASGVFLTETMMEYAMTLAHGGENFYNGWMKDKKTALVACNDGFRPVSFLLEATDEEADVFE